MKRIIFYSITCFFIFPFVTMGNEMADLLKLSEAYKTKNILLEFNIVLNYNNKKQDSYSGKYCKNEKGFYYSVFHIETYSDEKYSVVVDKNQKLVIVGDAVNENAGKEITAFLSTLKTDSGAIGKLYDLKYISSDLKVEKK